ncbi:putative two-component histidine kinase [Streptomyces sp. NBRC 110611]|uniref:GAF domain-containing protein n=1 Tax=Streptomyces sp. NBRC 110611 TaxID=1621259 RepID=UPI00085604D7|nr:GAF domain-containing protein [Streptomyces sp. NBRC 110611]GAU71000.1 putative two-component histidine kinase [Streptomyces sp. NBRC 110611]
MRCVLKSPDPAAEPTAGATTDPAKRAERSPHGPAGRPASRLPQLLEAMAAVGSDHDLHRALARIAETTASLTGARHAAIVLHPEEGERTGEVITHDGSPAPAGRPAEEVTMDVPITFHGKAFGALRLAGKRDGERFGEEDLRLVQVLATEAGIVMGNARMRAAARQRTRWIDGAASVTTALLAGPEAHSTAANALTVVAEKGRELAEAATAAVLLPHAEGGMEVVAISTELSDEVHSETYRGRIPPESPVLHQINAGHAVFADDFATDPRSISPLSRHYGPTMLLPLSSNGRVLGALALGRMSGDRPFSPTERTLGAQFAAQAALALVLADRHRNRRRLAVYEDRDRIARDLHDLVIQRLFATGMLLESAQRKEVAPEVRAGVSQAVDELDATIQEIRTAIIALQQGPPEAPPGLRTRVLHEAGTAAEALGARPSVQFVGPVDARVDDETARGLLTALRRALASVVPVAPASPPAAGPAPANASSPAAGPRPARTEIVVDAATSLPDGRPAVRLTVARPDSASEPVTWEHPL